jgi:hypothetical protein
MLSWVRGGWRKNRGEGAGELYSPHMRVRSDVLQKALAPPPVVFLIFDGFRHRILPLGTCSVSIHRLALAPLLWFLTHWLSSRHLRHPASPPPSRNLPPQSVFPSSPSSKISSKTAGDHWFHGNLSTLISAASITIPVVPPAAAGTPFYG